MSRKGKEGSELEYYRGMVRQQAKLIKHLQKQLARANKQVGKQTLSEDQLLGGEETIQDPVNACPKCRKSLSSIDLGTRIVYTCTCGYRGTEKI
jgi:predicted  nucleic acid-binding Zn ribbon protein